MRFLFLPLILLSVFCQPVNAQGINGQFQETLSHSSKGVCLTAHQCEGSMSNEQALYNNAFIGCPTSDDCLVPHVIDRWCVLDFPLGETAVESYNTNGDGNQQHGSPGCDIIQYDTILIHDRDIKQKKMHLHEQFFNGRMNQSSCSRSCLEYNTMLGKDFNVCPWPYLQLMNHILILLVGCCTITECSRLIKVKPLSPQCARRIGRSRMKQARFKRGCSFKVSRYKSSKWSLSLKCFFLWGIVILGLVLVRAYCAGCFRFGEADHPGPDLLSIATCNPTTIFGKTEDFQKFSHAIIGVSETAATAKVQSIVSHQFKKVGLHSKWSSPVQVYANNIAELRGVAGGTAVIAPFPIRPSQESYPDDFTNSTRFVDCHVQYMPHRFMYCVSLYGPTPAYKFGDPQVIMNRLLSVAAQRSIRFRGPAVIFGDFNFPLNRLDAWVALKREGWVDAGELSGTLNNHIPDPTSCDSVRHSYILINAELAKSLVECRTCHHYLF